MKKIDAMTLVCVLMVLVLVAVAVLYFCGVFGGNDASLVQWTINPANPASTIH